MANLIIVGANAGRVEEERQAVIKRRLAAGQSLEGITTSVAPIGAPTSEAIITRNAGYAPNQPFTPLESTLTGGGRFTGTGGVQASQPQQAPQTPVIQPQT